MLSSLLSSGRKCVHFQNARHYKKAVKTVKSTKSLEDLYLTPEAGNTTNPKPYALANRFYDPSIVRMMVTVKDGKFHSRSPQLKVSLRLADRMLHAITSDRFKQVHGNDLFRYTPKFDSDRFDIGNRLPDHILTTLDSDMDYRALAASLTVIQPKLDSMWYAYDNSVAERINSSAGMSFDTALLSNHAMQTYVFTFRKTNFHFQTPLALVQSIIKQRNYLLENKIQANVFEFSEDALNPLSELAAVRKESETISSTPVGPIQPSKEVERLGLILQLLAWSSRGVDKKDMGIVAVEAAEYGMKALTSLAVPAPFDSLKVIWKCAAQMTLPNSYLFYKCLYEQVALSIQADPLQLVGEEEAITSLMKSMVDSRFKSNKLIAAILDNALERGMDYHKIGLSMFGSLITLNAMTYANTLLNAWVENAEQQSDRLFQTQHRGSLVLPDQGTQMVCAILAQKKEFQYGDLAIVVTNCGSLLNPSGSNPRLLADIEASFLAQVSTLPVRKVVMLMQLYANVGRHHTQMWEAFDAVIASNFSSLGVTMLNRVVWANAKLNRRSTAYLDQVIKIFYEDLMTTENISKQKLSLISNLLWSLAVLEKLDLEMFAALRPMIERIVARNLGQDFDQITSSLFHQIWLEVRILLKQRGLSEEEWLRSTGDFNHREIVHRDEKLLPWQRVEFEAVWDEGTSSRTHEALSRQLRQKMGVEHENEVILVNGYSADIVIPVSEVELWSPAAAKRVLWGDLIDPTLGCSEDEESESESDVQDEIPVEQDGGGVVGGVVGGEEGGEVGGEVGVEEGVAEMQVAVAVPTLGQIEDDLRVPLDECLGLVVEFDGPSHFESFNKEELGATVMKRRHLHGAGYWVLNLPFWEFSIGQSTARKIDVLETRMAKIGLQFKKKKI